MLLFIVEVMYSVGLLVSAKNAAITFVGGKRKCTYFSSNYVDVQIQ